MAESRARRPRVSRRTSPTVLERINPDAAGIDCATSTALGAFYRRLAARTGKPHAVTATARKLAVLVYHVLKGDFVYKDPGVTAYERISALVIFDSYASAPPPRLYARRPTDR